MTTFKLSDVLHDFATYDLNHDRGYIQAVNSGTLDKSKAKKNFKRFIEGRKRMMDKDPAFKKYVLDICKYGWEQAKIKVILRRQFDNIVGEG